MSIPRAGGAEPWPGAAGHWRLHEAGANAVVAGDELVDAVSRALREAGSLYGFAASHPAAVALAGRGVAYSVPMHGGRWVVRHYRRGGAVARLLGDRYLRIGVARPWRELRASLGARGRGVATPRVVAAVVYPAGVFYRCDLVTEQVPDAVDLAELLFVQERSDAERLAACAAAGSLVRRMCAAGVLHRDLNLKNILIQSTAGPPVAHLLDLDRCRVLPRLTTRQARSMGRRLRRSLGKWEAATRRSVADSERRALGNEY